MTMTTLDSKMSTTKVNDLRSNNKYKTTHANSIVVNAFEKSDIHGKHMKMTKPDYDMYYPPYSCPLVP